MAVSIAAAFLSAVAAAGLTVRAVPPDTDCPKPADLEMALAAERERDVEVVYRVERARRARAPVTIELELRQDGVVKVARSFSIEASSCSASALPLAVVVRRALEEIHWETPVPTAPPARARTAPAGVAAPATPSPEPQVIFEPNRLEHPVSVFVGASMVNPGSPQEAAVPAALLLGGRLALGRNVETHVGLGLPLGTVDERVGSRGVVEAWPWSLTGGLALVSRGDRRAWGGGLELLATLQRAEAEGVLDASTKYRTVLSPGAFVSYAHALSDAWWIRGSLHAGVSIVTSRFTLMNGNEVLRPTLVHGALAVTFERRF